ncbi:hypothetical protein DXZ79_02285 [Yersinia rochesterensis]|uniref:Uncharacterized protein n=1 Tax=Yersinia rochesterensis TaxID=1604335 RepID=A0A8D4SPM2_9GAMM|nr:hypothetical protein DXZ79_02285 [Yersinia rochesterensis]
MLYQLSYSRSVSHFPVLNLFAQAREFFIGTGCALYEKSVLPQAPESKKIIFRFKCRLKQQYDVFTSTMQSINPKLLKFQARLPANTPTASRPKGSPKSLELWVGSQQTHPAELTSVSDSGKCAQLTPPQLQGRKVPQSHWSCG